MDWGRGEFFDMVGCLGLSKRKNCRLILGKIIWGDPVSKRIVQKPIIIEQSGRLEIRKLSVSVKHLEVMSSYTANHASKREGKIRGVVLLRLG